MGATWKFYREEANCQTVVYAADGRYMRISDAEFRGMPQYNRALHGLDDEGLDRLYMARRSMPIPEGVEPRTNLQWLTRRVDEIRVKL